MANKSYTIAVTGINATDNPGPGMAVIRSLHQAKSFNVRVKGWSRSDLAKKQEEVFYKIKNCEEQMMLSNPFKFNDSALNDWTQGAQIPFIKTDRLLHFNVYLTTVALAHSVKIITPNLNKRYFDIGENVSFPIENAARGEQLRDFHKHKKASMKMDFDKQQLPNCEVNGENIKQFLKEQLEFLARKREISDIALNLYTLRRETSRKIFNENEGAHPYFEDLSQDIIVQGAKFSQTARDWIHVQVTKGVNEKIAPILKEEYFENNRMTSTIETIIKFLTIQALIKDRNMFQRWAKNLVSMGNYSEQLRQFLQQTTFCSDNSSILLPEPKNSTTQHAEKVNFPLAFSLRERDHISDIFRKIMENRPTEEESIKKTHSNFSQNKQPATSNWLLVANFTDLDLNQKVYQQQKNIDIF